MTGLSSVIICGTRQVGTVSAIPIFVELKLSRANVPSLILKMLLEFKQSYKTTQPPVSGTTVTGEIFSSTASDVGADSRKLNAPKPTRRRVKYTWLAEIYLVTKVLYLFERLGCAEANSTLAREKIEILLSCR